MSSLDTQTRIHRPPNVLHWQAQQDSAGRRYPTNERPSPRPKAAAPEGYAGKHRQPDETQQSGAKHHADGHGRTELIHPLPPLLVSAPPLSETRLIADAPAAGKVAVPLTRAPLSDPEAEQAFLGSKVSDNFLERILRKLKAAF